MLRLSLKINRFIKNAFCRDLRRHRSHFGQEVARSFSTILISISPPSQIPKNRWGLVRNQKPIRGLCAHRGRGSERNRSPARPPTPPPSLNNKALKNVGAILKWTGIWGRCKEEVARSLSTIPTSSPSQIQKNRWGATPSPISGANKLCSSPCSK